MSGSLITLKHIQLQLHSDGGPVQVLRGIDLDIKRGETLGVVGPSGSGKTSLLMVIAGLEPATGRILSARQLRTLEPAFRLETIARPPSTWKRSFPNE